MDLSLLLIRRVTLLKGNENRNSLVGIYLDIITSIGGNSPCSYTFNEY